MDSYFLTNQVNVDFTVFPKEVTRNLNASILKRGGEPLLLSIALGIDEVRSIARK
jgi:hypothetical protein